MQPYSANRPALGYDLGADPATRTALAATAAAGEMRVYYTARIGPEAMQGSTFVAQMPVYQKSEGASADDAGDREYGDDTDGSADATARRRLRGYAVGAYQLPKIISRALESSARASSNWLRAASCC